MNRPYASLKTHYLFLRIFAVVGQARRPISVEQIAGKLNVAPDVVAHCIGLHLYLDRTHQERLTLPVAADYWVPDPSQPISRELLDPKSAGAMAIVDAVLKRAAQQS